MTTVSREEEARAEQASRPPGRAVLLGVAATVLVLVVLVAALALRPDPEPAVPWWEQTDRVLVGAYCDGVRESVRYEGVDRGYIVYSYVRPLRPGVTHRAYVHTGAGPREVVTCG